jgi:hypothetical protein
MEEYDEPSSQRDDSDYDDLESRVTELEAQLESRSSDDGVSFAYVSGMALAMVLSWSRNGSILWCMLHGVVSWVYVIYFAFTR